MMVKMMHGRREMMIASSDLSFIARRILGTAQQKMIMISVNIMGAMKPYTRSQVDMALLQSTNMKPTTRARIIMTSVRNLLMISRSKKQGFFLSDIMRENESINIYLSAL